MRLTIILLTGALALSACSKADKQADALDHAASEADPAAANAMRNAADAIRAGGSDANLSDPNSPAQAAMAQAGQAAAGTPQTRPADNAPGVSQLVEQNGATTQVAVGADTSGASPHKAGAPVPHTSTPTPKQ